MEDTQDVIGTQKGDDGLATAVAAATAFNNNVLKVIGDLSGLLNQAETVQARMAATSAQAALSINQAKAQALAEIARAVANAAMIAVPHNADAPELNRPAKHNIPE